jgi:repressor LexA
MKKLTHAVLKERAENIRRFYAEKGRMPSFSEVGELVGLSSKSSVFKLIDRLVEQNLLARDETGRLLPGQLRKPLRVLGSVEAGFPSPAEEELADTLSLDDLMVKNREATFLLKVSGDSMSGVGIMPGDMVIIDRSVSPKSGDIVVAEVDGAWTMKRLKKSGENVLLVAANPNYKPIRPKNELKIAGVVTGVVRKYQ